MSSTNPAPNGQNSASKLYLTPYFSDECTVWNGSAWETLTFSFLNNELAAGDNGKIFDLFAVKVGSAIDLERNWWGGSVRGTDLVLHEGILVKDGTTEGKKRRYLGTAFTGGTSQTPLWIDGWDGRYLYNYYNKVPREFIYQIQLASWTCPSQAAPGNWRCPNNNTGLGTVAIVAGQPDVFVHARLMIPADHPDDVSGTYRMEIGIGKNSQSAIDLGCARGAHNDVGSAQYRSLSGLWAELNTQLTTGYNYLQWLERVIHGGAGPVDNATFYGSGFRSGMVGLAVL